MSQDDLMLADRADTLTRARLGALDLRVDTKLDLIPETDADRAVESNLREALGRDRPGDPILGEEFGGTTTFSGRQWVIDPIDGTKNFVRGVPVWASLIALLVDGVPSVGVVSAPALQRRWWAAHGRGAFASVDRARARRLSVSSVEELGSASLSFSSLSGWAQRGLRERFVELTDAVWRVCAYGDFLICVGTPGKDGIRWLFSAFGLVQARAEGRWIAVGVEVQRPQRSEDQRPRGRRGSAAY